MTWKYGIVEEDGLFYLAEVYSSGSYGLLTNFSGETKEEVIIELKQALIDIEEENE